MNLGLVVFFDTAKIDFVVDAAVVGGQRPATRIDFWTNTNNAAQTLNASLKSTGTLVLSTATTSGTGIVLSSLGKIYSASLTNEASTQSALCLNTSTNEIQVNPSVASCTVSSLELKDWISDITCDESENIIKGMRPAIFKDKYNDTNETRFGFAAEWTDKVDPRLVNYYKGRPRSIDYERYTAVLTKFIQCKN